MPEQFTEAREASKYLSREKDQYGYIEAENTWITAIFKPSHQEDEKSEKLYFAATKPSGQPRFLSYKKFKELAQHGLEIKDELPDEVERKFFGEQTQIQEPDGYRFTHLSATRTIKN
jgi:hypothetical protein